MKTVKRLLDEYKHPGFQPQARLKGVFGDPQARVITLVRRQKKRSVAVATKCIKAITIKKYDGYEIYHVAKRGYT